MLISKLNRSRSFRCVFIICILIINFYPSSASARFDSFTPSELKIDNYFVAPLLNSVVLNENTNGQHDDRTFSPDYACFSKNIITVLAKLTDSKKIYNGGFSLIFRQSTFLSAHFSTST